PVPVEMGALLPVAVDEVPVSVVPLIVEITSAGVSPASAAPAQNSPSSSTDIAAQRRQDALRSRVFCHICATVALSFVSRWTPPLGRARTSLKGVVAAFYGRMA